MTSFRIALLLITVLLFCSCNDQNNQPSPDVVIKNTLDSFLLDAMSTYEIPGLALAVIKGDEILYKSAFGVSSLEDSLPVHDKTMFRVFSTTKILTATAIFQLIEDGKIALDDKINLHLQSIPQKWEDITIEHLLTHSSGLPNMIRYDNALSDEELIKTIAGADMDFETGNEFRYNQTNYWFLAQIIEHITGQPFTDFIIDNQFNSDGNDILMLSSSDTLIKNRSNKYNYNFKSQQFDRDQRNDGHRALAGNGLSITLDKFIEWNNSLDNNTLMSESTKSKMWSPFPYKNGNRDFVKGWGKYLTNGVESYGFSGGNLSNFRKFVNNDMTIILLSNGYRLNAYDIIVDDIVRMTVDDIKKTTPALESEIFKLVLNNDYDTAVSLYKKLITENPGTSLGNLKWNINKLGNLDLNNKNYENAINHYTINSKAYPTWWVSYAGIAEAYENLNMIDKSRSFYKKALELNTTNEMNYNKALEDKIAQLKNK